jgi:hypothetical protein
MFWTIFFFYEGKACKIKFRLGVYAFQDTPLCSSIEFLRHRSFVSNSTPYKITVLFINQYTTNCPQTDRREGFYICINSCHICKHINCKKRLSITGNNEIFPDQGELLSDIPAEKIDNLFLQCTHHDDLWFVCCCMYLPFTGVWESPGLTLAS